MSIAIASLHVMQRDMQRQEERDERTHRDEPKRWDQDDSSLAGHRAAAARESHFLSYQILI